MNGGPEAAEEFRRDVELAVAIFEGGDGRFEVARIGEAIGADGAEFGQAKGQAVVFADVAASLFLGEDDAEFDAARDDADLAGSDIENAEFGVKAKSAELRNDQQFAVGGVEEAILHGRVGGVEMDGHARLHGRIAVAAKGHDAVDEVGLLFGNRAADPSGADWARWEPREMVRCESASRESLRRGDASRRGECDRSRCGDWWLAAR